MCAPNTRICIDVSRCSVIFKFMRIQLVRGGGGEKWKHRKIKRFPHALPIHNRTKRDTMTSQYTIIYTYL